jgi:DNA polymerase
MAAKATIDFETRSAAPLKRCGAWQYAAHPSTEIMCLAWRLPDWAPSETALWHPAYPGLGIAEEGQGDLAELFAWLGRGGLVEAHNAWFERCIWKHVAAARLGWPPIPHRSWRCSAAKAASHALPRGLADATAALGLGTTKDEAGAKVMKKVSRPRASGITQWWESRELFKALWAYCRQDVAVEAALSEALPDLSAEETEVYLLDQAMNERGFALDGAAVDTALVLIERETARLTAELNELTQGNPDKATKRAKMVAWLAEQGVELEDTQKATVAEALEGDMAEAPRRVLEILREVGLASTAKYEAMRHWRASDGRAHGGLLYHGAGTGRWSGRGVQPQNFPKHEKDFDMEGTWQELMTLAAGRQA